VSVDCNGRFCYLDPYRGAMLAVAESARNVACSGGEPIGATNNLNFGNPERPEIMWQLAEAIRGIGDACRALDVPITGGNVSLYNETEGEAIYPTPVLGVVGLIEDASRVSTRLFRSSGASVVLLGDNKGELGGSEFLAQLHDTVAGPAPELDLVREKALQQLLVRLIREGVIESAHDCAEGGLAVTLAECAFDTSFGVTADVQSCRHIAAPFQAVAAWFGESASRVVVSARPEQLKQLESLAAECGVPSQVIGETGGSRLTFKADGNVIVDMDLEEAETAWATAIERRMSK
jgi:phosphoribosylformylglycinamidine synthase